MLAAIVRANATAARVENRNRIADGMYTLRRNRSTRHERRATETKRHGVFKPRSHRVAESGSARSRSQRVARPAGRSRRGARAPRRLGEIYSDLRKVMIWFCCVADSEL